MFHVKPLKADYSAYEPHISTEIMKLHHDGHYQGYINNLNAALNKHPECCKGSIPNILKAINEMPDDIKETVRNNGGGASNHEILWDTLSTSETQIHEGKFKEAIIKSFGSWETFKEAMFKSSASRFGSGWVWLVLDPSKNLKVYSTPNQDSPYMTGDYPVFGVDVWEHAYYLQFKNGRAAYMESIWKILDWKMVEQRYLLGVGG